MNFGEQRTKKQKKIDAEVLARVQNGIMRLEREHGPDWVDKFGGLEDFDIKSSTCCVLGKIYGDYDEGLIALNIRDDDQYRMGFNDHGEREDWDELQAAWEQELTALGVRHGG